MKRKILTTVKKKSNTFRGKIEKENSKKFNSERGSITVFVIIAFIFCMTILLNLYWKSSNYQISALQAEQRIKEIYESDVNDIDEIHNKLLAEKGITLTANDIGKYINYKPTNGSYSVPSKYSGSATATQDFSTENLKWRVWKVDGSYLYLISNNPTTSTLNLKGVQGYNNGVKLLDEICSNCYSNTTDYPGMTARSLDVLDLEDKEVTTYNYNGYPGYGTKPYTYSASFAWPAQWKNRDSKDTALPFGKRHEQDVFIEDNDNKTVTSSLENPYCNQWCCAYGHSGNKLANPKYYDLLCNLNDSTTTYMTYYWVASRFTYPKTDIDCYFGLQYMVNRWIEL